MTTSRAGRPLVIASGGASAAAPEHTIPAYEAAVEAGADALALDLHLSADDQLVVIRDRRLERTTDGRGAIRDCTLRELKRLDAGGWFGRSFRGQRIQTLSEVLERFRDRLTFGLAFRSDPGLSPGIEDRLVSLLQIYEVVDRTLVAAAEPRVLQRCRALDSDLRVSALLPGPRPPLAALAPPGLLHAVWLEAAPAREADVQACRDAGLACYVGSVNDGASARRLAAWGVAGLVTNRPELVRPALTTPGAR